MVDATEGLPKRYGVFDAEGAATGFWCDDIYPPNEDGTPHRKIPSEAIVLTEVQYRDLINNQPWARFVNGKVVIVDPPPSMDSSYNWGPTMGEALQ